MRAPPNPPVLAQAVSGEARPRPDAAPSRERLARETWRTWPNAVTALRVVAALACFVASTLRQDERWSFAGLGVYWALDVADGALARAIGQETRIGAQLDILSDRLLLGAFYATFLRAHPGMAIPVALHLFQFVVLDQYLSQQFLRWPCLSPNYFHEVDRTIWEWNWSAPAKIANGALATTAILVAGVAGWSWIVPAAVCAPVVVVKVGSIVRLASLPPPEPWIRRAGGRG